MLEVPHTLKNGRFYYALDLICLVGYEGIKLLPLHLLSTAYVNIAIVY